MFDFFAHHTILQGDCQLKDLTVEEELGRGNANVYTITMSNEQYAMKQIEIKTDYEYQKFLKEISFMKQLEKASKLMIKYKDYFLTKMEINQYLKHKYAFIIMQKAEMNLQQLINMKKQQHEKFTMEEVLKCANQLLQAFVELERQNIAHCDIKPENILIMNYQTLQLKLCDVGSCKLVQNDNLDAATILGTLPFLAPELIHTKSKKIVSKNPFKSDVFSLGLVMLYLLNFKKFKSHQRLEIDDIAYQQILQQWIRQAKQSTDNDIVIAQILKHALKFDQYQRPCFEELWKQYIHINKKKKLYLNIELQRLDENSNQSSIERSTVVKAKQDNTAYQSVPQVQQHINLFKSRKLAVANKTTINGNSFKITKTRNLSPASPLKKKNSKISMIGQITAQKNIFTMEDYKDIIYVTRTNQEIIPYREISTIDKIFVLTTSEIQFQSAASITVLSSCAANIFEKLRFVECKQLFIEFAKANHQQIPSIHVKLQFNKIKLNLTKSTIDQNSSSKLLRCLVNQKLQHLQLLLSQSSITFEMLSSLFDNLLLHCLQLSSLVLVWQRNGLTSEQHFILTQKISKLPIHKLVLYMNENYIKYDKQMRWSLPKQIQILYLNYAHNFLSTIITNLSLSLTRCSNLKQLYLNLQNNNLCKSEINILSQAVTSIKTISKLILHFSLSKINDIKYLSTCLLQLIHVTVLQLKLHKAQLTLEMIIQLIRCLVNLFDFKLKILKVSFNRNISLHRFKQRIQQQSLNWNNNNKYNKNIICNIVGFDHQFFMIYLKKKNMLKHKYSFVTHRKQDKNHLIMSRNNYFGRTITPLLLKTNNLHSNEDQTIDHSKRNHKNICKQLYTLSQSFDLYLCLGCCETKQTAKSQFYCKYCIAHCQHRGHNIVKVYQRVNCCCFYSGACKSDLKQCICAEKLSVNIKKQFNCLKCTKRYCLACIGQCKLTHGKWIQQSKENKYFKCENTQQKRQKIYSINNIQI